MSSNNQRQMSLTCRLDHKFQSSTMHKQTSPNSLLKTCNPRQSRTRSQDGASALERLALKLSLQSPTQHATSSLRCIRKRFKLLMMRCDQMVCRTLRKKRRKRNKSTLRKIRTNRPLMCNLRLTVKSQQSQNSNR